MAARKGIWCDTDCAWKWTAQYCRAKKECEIGRASCRERVLMPV